MPGLGQVQAALPGPHPGCSGFRTPHCPHMTYPRHHHQALLTSHLGSIHPRPGPHGLESSSSHWHSVGHPQPPQAQRWCHCLRCPGCGPALPQTYPGSLVSYISHRDEGVGVSSPGAVSSAAVAPRTVPTRGDVCRGMPTVGGRPPPQAPTSSSAGRGPPSRAPPVHLWVPHSLWEQRPQASPGLTVHHLQMDKQRHGAAQPAA
jgi:hypothetical protein